MTTYSTGNPLGSTAVKDLYDNAENLDHATNDRSTRVWNDRFGVARRTWYGMEQDFQDFLINSGYQDIGEYGPGLEITARNQVFRREIAPGQFELYRPGANLDLPYTTTGDWEQEGGQFVAAGGQLLRQQLADSTDPENGAGMVGYEGHSVADELQQIGQDITAGRVAVTPAMFDVTDASTENQTEKIRAMHAYANEHGLSVDYAGLGSVYVDADAQIEIKTSAEFRGCVFSLVGGISASPTYDLNELFIVAGSELVAASIDPMTLTLNTTKPLDSSGNGLPDGFYHVKSNKRIGNRSTAPSVNLYYEQSFNVIKGEFTYPCGENLSANTVEVTHRPNDRPIRLNDFAVDVSTYNNQCLFRVRRNGVAIDRPATLGGPEVGGICQEITVESAAAFEISNGRLPAKTYSGSGTYTISMERVSDVVFRSLSSIGKGSWGATGCNWVTNLRVIDSHLNRVDVHQGAHGLTVEGGSIAHGGQITYGWGTGHISVRNTLRYGGYPILEVRDDYDGNFNGSISVRTIVYKASPTETPFSNGVQICNFRGVYGEFETRVATEIVVDDILIDYSGDNNLLTVVGLNFGPRDLTKQVRLPNRIKMSNIRGARGHVYFANYLLFAQYLAPLSGTLVVDFSDIQARTSTSAFLLDGGNVTAPNEATFPMKINVRNSTGVVQRAAWMNAEVTYENCEIGTIKSYIGGDSQQVIRTVNCTMRDTVAVGEVTVGNGGVGALVLHQNLLVLDATSLANADGLNGIFIRSGVTCALPSGLTYLQARQGWARPGKFVND